MCAGSRGRRPLLRAEDGGRAGGSSDPRGDSGTTAGDRHRSAGSAGNPAFVRPPPDSRGLSSADSHAAPGAHGDPGSSPERDPASRGGFLGAPRPDPDRSAGAPGRGGSCDPGSGNSDRTPDRRDSNAQPGAGHSDSAPDCRAADGAQHCGATNRAPECRPANGAPADRNADRAPASRYADGPRAADRDREPLSRSERDAGPLRCPGACRAASGGRLAGACSDVCPPAPLRRVGLPRPYGTA